jgi:hypothetical protein
MLSQLTLYLTIAGRRAMWITMKRCAESNLLQSLSMQVHLFGALVAPVLSYCSEIWGPALKLSTERWNGPVIVSDSNVDKSSTCCSV